MVEKKYGLATTYSDGLMSKTDKAKLDNLTSGGGGGGVGAVTGVKGDAESAYRIGDVNITKENIGLGNVDNTSDADKPISNATQNALDNKVDKESGKGLSSNDYTSAEKMKLAGIASGAEANVQSDWLVTNTNNDAYIKNKPTKVSEFTNDANYLTQADLADYGVSGVKGNAESAYRVGQVNITPANIGLGNVNNTSDANKPISTATQNALDKKVDKVNGKDLSTNDFTNALKTKLDGIEAGAEVNQSAFSYVKVGESSIAADEKKDTLEVKGDNVTLSADFLNDILTIGLTKENVLSALGYTPSAGQVVEYEPTLTSGTEIGTLKINDVANKLYAPLILALKSAVTSNTESGKTVDALLIKEIFNALPFKFGIDADGNYGYYKDGADTVTPFKSGGGGDGGVVVVDGYGYMEYAMETSWVPVYPLRETEIADGYARLTVNLVST